MQVGVQVSLLPQEREDVLGAPGRPMVRGERDIGTHGEQVDRLGDVAGPDAGIADLRTPQGEEVVQVVGDVLGQAQHPTVREEEVHLRRRLGAGSELEDDPHTVEDFLLPRLGDVESRREKADGSLRSRRTQAHADAAGRSDGEACAAVVHAATQHRHTGVDVLRDGVLQEV